MVPCCCNGDSLKFDMHHDHVLKEWNFDLYLRNYLIVSIPDLCTLTYL